MSLFQEILNCRPVNEQEERDKELMLQYMLHHTDYLRRENQIAHFTASIWTVNREHTKTLMVYHNIYNSWSWVSEADRKRKNEIKAILGGLFDKQDGGVLLTANL